jgi:hypothetical protein
MLGTAQAGATPNPHGATVRAIQRLSHDLRGRGLSKEERGEIDKALVDAGEDRAVYESYVEKWLTRPAYTPLLRVLLPEMHGASALFLRLEREHGPSGWLYYLPHSVNRRAPEAPACSPSDTVEVVPWWGNAPVRICRDSYRPDRAFDDVGYCAGQPEPTVPTPPRLGCGCGPLLLGCLPEHDEHLDTDALDQAIQDEVLETAADIVATDRPFDDLLTTTRTWQDGFVRFLYLRRDLLRTIAHKPYSDSLEKELRDKLATIDLHSPGQWVERGGVYRGSGLFTSTISISTIKTTHRVLAKDILTDFLCTEFLSVHVDSEALLKAVGAQHGNLRTLAAIGESPMRNQQGCKGCHAPMDNAAAFLVELQTALYGSYPTGLPAPGQLFLKGAGDYRGRGTGLADFARLVVAQPEFSECATRRTLELFLHRAPLNSERDLLSSLTNQFNTTGHRWLPLVRAVLLSKPYREPTVSQ